MTYLDSGADISPCGRYRYRLWRTWDRAKPVLTWCMLNPSTAGAEPESDDATIRKIGFGRDDAPADEAGFSRRWGYGGIVVVNLYPYRATDPRELRLVVDLDGGRGHERLMALAGSDVVLAWGDLHREYRGRASNVSADARHVASRVRCLGRTKSGQPRHPVRLPYATELVAW